jgi:hypothetical protein
LVLAVTLSAHGVKLTLASIGWSMISAVGGAVKGFGRTSDGLEENECLMCVCEIFYIVYIYIINILYNIYILYI